jgi:hypothetical protein
MGLCRAPAQTVALGGDGGLGTPTGGFCFRHGRQSGSWICKCQCSGAVSPLQSLPDLEDRHHSDRHLTPL